MQGDAKVDNITAAAAAASAAKVETSATPGTLFSFEADVPVTGVSSVVSSPGAGAFPPTPDEFDPYISASLSSSATVSVDPSDVVCFVKFATRFKFTCTDRKSFMANVDAGLIECN